MPSLASGTFAQTAASTAMTAPDYRFKTKRQCKDVKCWIYLLLNIIFNVKHCYNMNYLIPLLMMGKDVQWPFYTCS